MKKYTVVCDYFATGEGRTFSVWMGFADNARAAKKLFASAVSGGSYYAPGADVIEGFDFDNPIVEMFMTMALKGQLGDENCHRSFSGQLHFNYS
jgi:hypothetical protein